MLKDEIRKAEDIKTTNLFKHLKTLKEFGASFNYAIILLGAFFGFKKFYDAYYDNLNLRFYKSYLPVKDKKEEPEKIASENQTESNEPTSSKEELLSDENQGLEDRPKTEEHTLATDIQELKVEPVIQDHPLNDQQSSEEIPSSTDPILTEVATKPKEQKIGINDNNDFEPKEIIESKTIGDILPTADINQEATEGSIEEQTISNSETETVIKFKRIIKELLTAKTEMKLTDIGHKIKEQTGQKVTNTIIKNVIKSMDNVEIVPKKTPETARQVTIQDLFNKQI
jgi:hypothetical protein